MSKFKFPEIDNKDQKAVNTLLLSFIMILLLIFIGNFLGKEVGAIFYNIIHPI